MPPFLFRCHHYEVDVRELTSMKNVPPFKLAPEPQNDDAKNLPGFKWTGKEIRHLH